MKQAFPHAGTGCNIVYLRHLFNRKAHPSPLRISETEMREEKNRSAL